MTSTITAGTWDTLVQAVLEVGARMMSLKPPSRLQPKFNCTSTACEQLHSQHGACVHPQQSADREGLSSAPCPAVQHADSSDAPRGVSIPRCRMLPEPPPCMSHARPAENSNLGTVGMPWAVKGHPAAHTGSHGCSSRSGTAFLLGTASHAFSADLDLSSNATHSSSETSSTRLWANGEEGQERRRIAEEFHACSPNAVAWLHPVLHAIVMASSIRQAVAGLIATGPMRSLWYVGSKLQKRVQSLGQ
jgi:hypothetical protein